MGEADGSVIIDTQMDGSGLRKGMESMKADISKASADLSKMANTGIKAVAVGFGAIVAASANFAKATDRVDKLSQSVGISRNGFQEWDYVLSQNGAKIEDLEMGMKTLVSQIEKTASASDASSTALGRLGVSAKNADGSIRDQEEVMVDAIAALQRMEKGTIKSGLAADLFARASMGLMPLLNQTAESTDDLRKRAHELGLVLGDDSVDAGVAFGDTMDDMKKALLGLLNSAIGPLIPQITNAIQSFIKWAIEGDRLKNVLSSFATAIKDAWENGLIPAILSFVATLKVAAIAMGILNAVMSASPLMLIVLAIAAVAAAGTAAAIAIGKADDSVASFTRRTERASKQAIEASQGLQKWDAATQDVIKGAKENNKQDKLTQEQIDKLTSMYPGLVDEIDLYSASLDDVAKKLKEVHALEVQRTLAPLIKNYQKQRKEIQAVTGELNSYKMGHTELMNEQKKKIGPAWNAEDVALQTAALEKANREGMSKREALLAEAAQKGEKALAELNKAAMENGLIYDTVLGTLRQLTEEEVKAARAAPKKVVAAVVTGDPVDALQKAREEMEAEWAKKLLELTDNTLEKQMAIEIAAAEAIGARTADIRAYYAKLMYERDQDLVKKAAQERWELEQDAAKKRLLATVGVVGTRADTRDEATGVVTRGDAEGGSELGNILSGVQTFFEAFSGAFSGFLASIVSLESVSALLNPIQTIFKSMMTVLEPIINDLLGPLVGILDIIGKTVGAVLVPALTLLKPVVDLISQLFIFLYNKIIAPIANAIIWVFNAVIKAINFFVDIINAALGWLGVHINRLAEVDYVSVIDTTSQEASAVTAALTDANKALADNKKLFQSAGRAGEAYKKVLTGITKSVSDVYEGLQNIGSDIAGTIIDSLLAGFDNDDFLYAMEEYIVNAIVQVAVFTDAFTAEVARIGTALAQAIASGDTNAIARLKDQLSALYTAAATTAQAVTDSVSSAFNSYDVGSLSLPSDGLIYAHKNEAVIPAGLMSEAMTRGLTIAPTSSLISGVNNFTLNMKNVLTIDGREVAAVAFKYQDELIGAAYGT